LPQVCAIWREIDRFESLESDAKRNNPPLPARYFSTSAAIQCRDDAFWYRQARNRDLHRMSRMPFIESPDRGGIATAMMLPPNMILAESCTLGSVAVVPVPPWPATAV